MSYVRGPSYVIRPVEGYATPRVSGREITVGLELLRLDAGLSVLGESLASLLLPPVEYSDDVADVVKSYRRRVVIEEASDLVARAGRAAGVIKVPSYFFPLSRMSKLSWLYSCIFNDASRDLERLGEGYADFMELVGSPDGRVYISLSEQRVRGSFASVLGSVVKSVAAGVSVAGTYMSLLLKSSECPPNVFVEDPYRTLEVPEGIFMSSCRWADHVVELDGSSRCRRSSMLYSSTVCEDEEGRLVIKDYGYGTFKWLFAGIMSVTAYPFTQTPNGRASNEYRGFIELRRYIRTPRVLSVCLTPMEASMVREYIDGQDVLRSRDPSHWEEAGKALATVHRAGYAMGDPNPGNIIITEGGPALIDVEQVSSFTPQKGAWDLAVFFYYSRFFGAPLDLVRESLRSYASSLDQQAWRRVRRQVFSPRLAPFLASLPPLFFELRSSLESIKP